MERRENHVSFIHIIFYKWFGYLRIFPCAIAVQGFFALGNEPIASLLAVGDCP
jgi:hypothetical protein